MATVVSSRNSTSNSSPREESTSSESSIRDLVGFRTANGTRSAVVDLEEVISSNTLVTCVTWASSTSDWERSAAVSKTTGANSVGGQRRATRNFFELTRDARKRITGSTDGVTSGKRARCVLVLG